MIKKNLKELTELQIEKLRKKIAIEVAKDKKIRKMVINAIKDGVYRDPTDLFEYLNVPKKYIKYFEGGGLPNPDDADSYAEAAERSAEKEKAIKQDPTIEILYDSDGATALMDAVIEYVLRG